MCVVLAILLNPGSRIAALSCLLELYTNVISTVFDWKWY